MVADPEQEVRSLAKKVLWILFAVVLVLALAVAGVTGYFWYQNNHIFVEDAVYPINAKTLDLRGQDISFEHYDAVHSQLPNCEIYWDVPFQVGKYPNDTTKLTVADLTEKDIRILVNYFPKLKTLDATACSDYLDYLFCLRGSGIRQAAAARVRDSLRSQSGRQVLRAGGHRADAGGRGL